MSFLNNEKNAEKNEINSDELTIDEQIELFSEIIIDQLLKYYNGDSKSNK